MARMRTVKPEFWEDEVIGSLCRDARLLFIATWNLADDEGLLRWMPEYLKASAFMYDDDVSVPRVQELMQDIEIAGLVFAYHGGKTKQRLAFIVQFHRHQRVNRPQPSKLQPPSLQSLKTLTMYRVRDGDRCHLCGETVLVVTDSERLRPSLDHVVPQSKGGSDYPSNIRLAHLSCNKARRDKACHTSDMTEPQVSAGGEPLTDPFTERLTDPFTPVREGKGREGKGAREARDPPRQPATTHSNGKRETVAERNARTLSRKPDLTKFGEI